MNLTELIRQGEGTRLEFKSTLQWDVKQGKRNDDLRKMVLKTIAAFLNTEGGTLIIGVEDDGNVYGLDADLALVNNSRDKFAQLVGTLLIEQLGAAYAAPPLVNARFDEVDGKTVYVVEVQPSSEPVYLKDDKGKQLYIRVQTTTRDLDAKDAVEYSKSHWGEPNKSKKTSRSQEGESNFMAGAFHTIAIPHDDILQGRLTLDIFAADLWEVFKGRGVEEYRNPDLFFQKTYETEGLKTLLGMVEKRIKGKGGDPILQIQTPFGGGKTHTLIAMFHKANEWGARRVVMVGTKMAAKDTLWSMLEEQITGKVKRFKDLVSPGATDEFREMLSNAGPTLILMDEVLEYITKAAGVTIGDSNLADQTIAFMQELTETISSLANIVLVVTLPSSNMPNMNEKAQKLLQNLQYVSGRMEKIFTPVQENEITSVIRQRLFSMIDKKKASKVINQFVEYATQQSLLPAGMEASEYRTRFEASYPFLPEVVDVLYQRWGSYYTFQRTRGVLRLLALVIFAIKEKGIPYITLADFNLADQEIRQELLKHIGMQFNGVIAADITSPESGAAKINANLGKAYQGLKLGERVTTAIFMYSFSGGTERGVTLTEIKRNAAVYESPSAVVAEAVEELKGRLFYIQNQSGKYFFSNQANLNHLLLVRMENIAESEVKAQEEKLLKENIRNDKFKSYIWRTESADIPETPDLKLIVLPENNPAIIKTLIEEKGGSPRVHRNTLFFLVPMPSERVAFGNTVRRFLAYQALQSDITLNLTADQLSEIKTNQKRLEGELAEGLRRLYRQIYLPAKNGIKDSDLGVPTSGYSGYIDQEVYERLRSDGEILEKIAPLVIREKFLKDRDFVSTAQLYQSSLKTPGEARATSQTAWDIGIAEGVRSGLFGLGEMKDETPVCNYYKQEATPAFTDNEILIKAEICQAQIKDRESQTTFAPGGSNPSGGIGEPPTTSPNSSAAPTSTTLPDKGLKQLSFNFTVPKGKVANLMGVLNYLQSKYEHMDISLHLDRGQMTEQEYEDKVKEAFRQMGIDID